MMYQDDIVAESIHPVFHRMSHLYE
jgi:hypothetical protein